MGKDIEHFIIFDDEIYRVDEIKTAKEMYMCLELYKEYKNWIGIQDEQDRKRNNITNR